MEQDNQEIAHRIVRLEQAEVKLLKKIREFEMKLRQLERQQKNLERQMRMKVSINGR